MLNALKSIILTAVICLVLIVSSSAQGITYRTDQSAKSLFDLPPRNLINAPTAGTLPRGCFDVIMRVYGQGGLLWNTSIGLSNRFQLGMSYGAEGLISEYSPEENPRIEFNAKLRLIDESYLFPAIAVGFNSQGYGAYLSDFKRYTYKSKGFYAVASRSFALKDLAVGGHVGVNYSLEHTEDKDKEPPVFFGLDARFAHNIGFTLEYEIALNDDQDFAKGRGFFNTAIKWMYSENLELELIISDIFLNRKDRIDDGRTLTIGRELRFTYIEFF